VGSVPAMVATLCAKRTAAKTYKCTLTEGLGDSVVDTGELHAVVSVDVRDNPILYRVVVGDTVLLMAVCQSA